jgi:hypothetical protein
MRQTVNGGIEYKKISSKPPNKEATIKRTENNATININPPKISAIIIRNVFKLSALHSIMIQLGQIPSFPSNSPSASS